LVEITSGDELASFLARAKEIEMAFETVVQWEGYIDVKKEEFRDLLFKLISDSDRHDKLVDRLMSMVKMDQGTSSKPLTPRTFTFKNKNEMEIMMEIGKYEKLIHDLYNNIMAGLNESNLRPLLKDESKSPEFLSVLGQLIAEEKGHMNLVSKYVGKIERIR